MAVALAPMPAAQAAAPAPGGAPDALPDGASGRAFRALLGRQASARQDARTAAEPDAATPSVPSDETRDAAPSDAAGRPESSEASEAATAEPAPSRIDPALQHLLQPGALPPAASSRAGLPAGEAATSTDDSALAPAPARTAGRALQRPGANAAPDAADLRDVQGEAAAGRAAEGPAFSARLADALPAEPAALRVDAAAAAGPPLVPTVGQPAAARSESAAPPPAAAHVPAAPDSAEFPGQFGLQIATFARDGVEHAELHLNPADLGPVAVQIALDGTHARVELSADVAATRDALQHSLPALAAALREAGLTLAGGSVSSRAGGQAHGERGGSGGEPGGARRARGLSAPAAVAAPVRQALRLGGVDLYA